MLLTLTRKVADIRHATQRHTWNTNRTKADQRTSTTNRTRLQYTT